MIMFLDWFIQYKNIRKSTNLKRFITGILCGFRLIGLYGKYLYKIEDRVI